MKLLIVESPKKIRVLLPLLGDEWQVEATAGHFRDLPSGRMAIRPDTLRPDYEIKAPDVVDRITRAARGAETVYVATDPDREGEAIAHHLQICCALPADVPRVRLRALTQSALAKAINNPGVIDTGLVEAQEARRVIDRLTGYMVSPALAESLGRGVSAGRVQSPALRMVVERERAIARFTPETHYDVVAQHADGWQARWHFQPFLPKGMTRWPDGAAAAQIARTHSLRVIDQKTRERAIGPPPGLTTSTLQQLAAAVLDTSPEDTMQAAQQLFEAGAITYHRTDNPNLHEEAIHAIRAFLKSERLPVAEQPQQFPTPGNAEAAHEAIRPTALGRTAIDEVDETANRLYTLIRVRTLASQAPPAILARTRTRFASEQVKLQGEPALFQAFHNRWRQRGYCEVLAKLFPEPRALYEAEPSLDPIARHKPDDSRSPVPTLTPGSVLPVICEAMELRTEPPPRFSEGQLIRELDQRGIGRPSTFASILANLKQRGLVRLDGGVLVPEEIAGKIIDRLSDLGFEFLHDDYTASMEAELDAIAQCDANDAAAAAYDTCVRATHDTLLARISEKGLPAPQMDPSPLPGHGEPCPTCSTGYKTTRAVRKEGPNQGRRYLDCSDRHCDFKHRPVEEGWPEYLNYELLPQDGDPCPQCLEGHRKTLVVRQEGPNKGKRFYVCSAKGCDWREFPED